MSFELILPFLRPIESLLLDESVSEIMGNPDSTWWYERDGILWHEPTIEFDPARLRTGLEVVANKLGKKLDEDNPLLNAQLPDGSRLAAVIPPVVRPRRQWSTYAAVAAINPAANLLTVEKSSGEQVSYDPRRLTGVSCPKWRRLCANFVQRARVWFLLITTSRQSCAYRIVFSSFTVATLLLTVHQRKSPRILK